MSRPLCLIAVTVILLSSCRGVPRDGASADASADAPVRVTSAAVATPAPVRLPPPSDDRGPGPKLSPSPLGPPDAIEPPTRIVVPGMTVAHARAAGAKGKEPWLEVTPDVTAWVDERTSRISRL